MDAKLAEMYGTNIPDDGDIEKLAAAEFADNLAEDGQIDLDNIDPDALEALASDVLGEGDDDGDEDQEKVAEADYLGRVMAHSYVQELRGIEKQAGFGEHARRFGGAVKDVFTGARARAGHKALKAEAKKGVVAERLMKNVKKHGVGAQKGEKVSDKLQAARDRVSKKADRASAARRERNVGAAQTGAAYMTTAGGAGLAGHKALKKESSALDTLAMQRAYELLEAAGIDPNAQQEKTSGADDIDVLEAAVEQRAYEILAANGYVTE